MPFCEKEEQRRRRQFLYPYKNGASKARSDAGVRTVTGLFSAKYFSHLKFKGEVQTTVGERSERGGAQSRNKTQISSNSTYAMRQSRDGTAISKA